MSTADLVTRISAGVAFLALDIVALIALLRDDRLEAGAAVVGSLLCGAFAFRRIRRVTPY